jgi:hypothetical protein
MYETLGYHKENTRKPRRLSLTVSVTIALIKEFSWDFSTLTFGKDLRPIDTW